MSKSEIKELRNKLEEKYGDPIIDKKDIVVKEENLIYVNNECMFFDDEIPTLKLLLKKDLLKKVVVDMGAVKFVTSGADIMRPGIVKFEESKKDDYVAIIDEKHNKPLAIGKMIYDSEEAVNIEKGKVVKNIHYIGDEIWTKSY